MSTLHRETKRVLRHIQSELVTIAGLVLIAVAIWMSFGGSISQKNVFASVEVKFTDRSVGGLEIMPASCPSDIHYVGECSPPYVPPTPPPPPQPDCAGKIGSWLGDKAGCPPACAANTGAACSSGQNICGMTGGGAIQCDGSCNASIPSNSLCPVTPTPPPTTGTPGGAGGTCVSNVGTACSGAANICGMRNAGTIQCAGGCGATTPSNSLCPAMTCWDGSSIPAGGVCPACPEGYSAVGNSCVPPAGPEFIGFPTTQGFNASGHLEVRPSLVRSGDRTRLYWGVTNVRDCTVRGTNGDGSLGSVTGVWDMLTSGASGQQTSPIYSRTDYTLFCRSLVGATPSTISETRTVNVIPSWYEPQGAN